MVSEGDTRSGLSRRESVQITGLSMLALGTGAPGSLPAAADAVQTAG